MKLIAKLSICAVIISTFVGCGKSAPKVEKKLGPAETIVHVSKATADGDASASWTSLPKSWRTDINSIAHMLGEKMPTNMWDDVFTLVGRIGKVFEGKSKILTDMVADQLPPDMKREDVEKSIASFGKLFTILAQSDLAKVESLKKIDLGSVVDKNGSEVLNLVLNNKLLNDLIKKESKGKADSLKNALSNIKAELVSESGNTAKVKVTDPDGKVEEVEMVKVEDKWVAKKMADEFSKGIAEIKAELPKSLEKIPEMQMQVGMVVGMAGGVVSALESAKSAEDIKKAFAGLPINPLGMMGALGGARAKAQEAREKAHLKLLGTHVAMHFSDGGSTELEGTFKQFKDLNDVGFDLNQYVILFEKGDAYSGSAEVVLFSEKPDPSKDGVNVVFQDGHVSKITGSFKTVDDIKKAITAAGYKLKN